MGLEQFLILLFFLKIANEDNFWDGINPEPIALYIRNDGMMGWFLWQNLLSQENDTGVGGPSLRWLWGICWHRGTELSHTYSFWISR